MSAYSRYCALAALYLTAASAQISTGTIVGVVEDASGAVVPNAQVTLRQTATGETRKTVTTASGEFNLPFLQVGPYTVSASANGFKTKTLSGITLRVDQTINLRITLEVGAATRDDRSDRRRAAGRFGHVLAGAGDREQGDHRHAFERPQSVRARPALRQHHADVRHGIESARLSPAAAASPPTRSRSTAWTTTPSRTRARSAATASPWCRRWTRCRSSRSRPTTSPPSSGTPPAR